MDVSNDKERLAYEIFLIIEQSGNGTGDVIDEDNIWRSFMEICNARCGARFTSPDAARMAIGRISSAIPLERLEELYEKATGREFNVERPAHYPREIKDRSPEDVKQSLAYLPSGADDSKAEDDDVDFVQLFDELKQDWLEDFQRRRIADWQKGSHKRFSQS